MKKQEGQSDLREELKQFEQLTEMTSKERKDLQEWVAEGNSVYSNPGNWAYESGCEMNFIDALRMEAEKGIEKSVEEGLPF